MHARTAIHPRPNRARGAPSAVLPPHTARAHSVFGSLVHLGLSTVECRAWLNEVQGITERYRHHLDAASYLATWARARVTS